MRAFQPMAARDYASAVTDDAGAGVAPVPVPVEGRPDLERSVALAEELYGGVGRPPMAELGLALGDEVSVRDNWVLRQLATVWADGGALPAVVGAVAAGALGRVLVAGVYERMTSAALTPLLRAAHRAGAAIGILTGRDARSVAWMAAKQWVRPRPEVVEHGLFSSVTGLRERPGFTILGPRELEEQDVKRRLLGQRWRAVMFQGHGKDDHVNLGDFTICGRNEVAPDGTALRPRCGYGLPCFKPEAGLIDLRMVPATEIVLSACNSGPMADLTLYDRRYLLSLNAVDGVAQRVSCAMNVHNSHHPENAAWMDELGARALAGDGAPAELASAAVFETTLRTHMPHATFWHFGLPPRTVGAAAPPPEPDPDLLLAARRVHALIAGDLLPPQHRLRSSLPKVNEKLSRYAMRAHRSRDGRDGGTLARQIRSDIGSLDAQIADLLSADPEDDLSAFGDYFAERGALDPASLSEVACPSCGRPATFLTHRPHLPSLLPVSYIMCQRCGDAEVLMAGAPRLAVAMPAMVRPGESAPITVTVAPAQRGCVRLGMFLPGFARAHARIEPATPVSRRARAGRLASAQFTLSVSPTAAPQAYYVTAFAVAHLGLGTARRHFGIVPR